MYCCLDLVFPDLGDEEAGQLGTLDAVHQTSSPGVVGQVDIRPGGHQGVDDLHVAVITTDIKIKSFTGVGYTFCLLLSQ